MFEAIQVIAKNNAIQEDNTQASLELFLKSWWSRTYNRPLKDPILQEYTIYELLYEYHDKIERENAKELHFEQETDKIEEGKEQEALDWAAEEEKKELEAAKKKLETSDAWMLDQLKKEHGEDFGNDASIDF